MKYLSRLTLLALVLVATVAFVATAHAEKVPKVDNFILFVDHSGSMAQSKAGAKKIESAKTLLTTMNQVIPELDYTSAVYTFAPVASYSQPGPYKTGQVAQAINGIDTDYEIFGRQTPMGNGIIDLDSVLSGLDGKTAVVMVTDGNSNLGADPVAQAQAVYAKYGGKVCFHVVSMADTAHGQMVIDEIRAMNGCSVPADAATLMKDSAAMNQFVEDVFFTERMAAAPAPAPEPMAESIVIRLNFDFDRYNIKDSEVPKLEQALMLMQERPGKTFLLEGWTDSIGTDEYNMGLSQRRADSVRSWLVEHGMAAGRLEAVGKGKSFKYDNSTSDGRYQNRRVEIHIR